MRHILFLLFMAFTLQAIAQYPATGNKMRLGWQTTGDGLVYRGAIGDTATLDPSGINNAWMLLDTANGNLYAYRAKAWRLVSGGGGGGGLTMPFDSVTFNVNETDASLRELKYSEEKGYLQYGGQDSVQIPLLPGIWYVRNDTSVTIPKGSVVRATGTLGASGRIKVKHMIANGSIDAMYILGIAMQDIAVGADGYAMSQGKIRQVNTQAYSEGAVLYADVDTLGGLTQTEPTGSNLKLPIAFVVHSASNGTLAVRVSPGTYLRDLHDVYITSPDSSASLYYNSSESVWRDTTAAVLTSDTSVFARDFQISGTANRLAMFTGSNTVGNSVVDVTSDTVSIRDYSNSYTTWRFHSNINKRGFIGYPSGTRFYSLVNPSLYAGFMYGDRSAGAQDQQAFTQLTAFNGGGAVSGFFSAATTLNGADSTLYFNISGLSANANPTFPAAQMVIQKGGNVGIGTASPGSYLLNLRDSIGFSGNGMYFSSTNGGTANPGGHIIGTKRGLWGTRIDFVARDAAGSLTETVMSIDGEGGSGGNVGINISSPSRPLHVAGTTAIRIPVGTTAQRPSDGANGDIRYSTTFNNIEFYDGSRGLWERPLVGTVANNKVAFALGDTLTSNTNFHWDNTNTRLGIGNAAPDSTLTVTGGIRATRDMYARRYNVSTFTGQVLSINNYAPAGSPGFNIFMGNGGENLNWANGENASYNIGIGFNSLLRVTTAQGNIGIGVDACRNITSGINNIAIGVSSLANTTIANDNFGLGAGTLFRNTIGSSNTAIGNYALLNGVTASSNTGIGLNALYNNTGNNNVGIGTEVLFYQTAASNNSAFGYQAGSRTNIGSNNETSSNSIYIGYDTRASTSGNQNEIVIGYQGRGNGSNTTTIGNSSTTATILPAGSLGIAITSPTARLHLPAGTASANTAPLKFTSGTNLTTPEAGAVEWNGTNVFVTNSSATRQTVNQGLTGSATMDFPNTDAQKSSDLTITVTGASDGDVVSLGVPNAAVNANTCYTAWVSAVNTVTIRFNNYSTGAINPASATFKVFVTKF